MTKFKINADVSGVPYRKTVEAVKFRHEGDYFFFYGPGDSKVYAVASSQVLTVEKELDSK
ncbi:hypothetical protein [Microbacterium sp. CIAB417]|uniref:hypothetical protein n=1 Tax=Microbacterium sp. CIAB417 TaxID=2860287 RepID=UPI001FACF419|nr:hypothetical protein [Microbacterium sp. CIAB417]